MQTEAVMLTKEQAIEKAKSLFDVDVKIAAGKLATKGGYCVAREENGKYTTTGFGNSYAEALANFRCDADLFIVN